MGHFATVLSYLHSFAGPTLMLLYPLYASIRAIESPSKMDDEQWLVYWILYSFLTLFEIVAQPVLNWVPAWYHIKLMLTAWLVLPQFRGAAFVYEKFVREQLRKFGGGAAAADAPPDSKDMVEICGGFVTVLYSLFLLLSTEVKFMVAFVFFHGNSLLSCWHLAG